MPDDIKRSFSSVFKKRLTSPLYGSFAVSWVLWNWKIIYLTMFVSQELIIPLTKIEYILKYYTNWYFLVVFPVLSTIVFIGALPLLANLAYKISLDYELQRKVIRDRSDAKKKLTTAELAVFQRQLMEKEDEHNNFIDTAYTQIQKLEKQVKLLEKEKSELADQLTAVKLKEFENVEEMQRFAWMEVTSGKTQKEIAIRLLEKFHISERTANELAEATVMKYGPDIYGKYS